MQWGQVSSSWHVLKNKLAAVGGAALINSVDGETIQDYIDRRKLKLKIGDLDYHSATAQRDAVYCRRTVSGNTDCHAFADKTELSGVTDAGTYGSFDATAKLSGANAQNHMHAFQDRNEYNGSNTITDFIGYLSAPVHSGTGAITNRYAIDIRDPSKTGGGTIGANIGLYIRNQTAGGSNVAVNIAQTAGYAIYAAGGAESYHKGDVKINTKSATGAKLSLSGDGGTTNWVAHTSSTYGYCGMVDDKPLHLLVNGGFRVEVSSSANAYALRPAADGTQPLGDASHRWSAVYASNGTIQTSDRDQKTDIRALNDAEIAVARDLKRLIRVFRMREAVEIKGDNARLHCGVIAQEVEEAFTRHGLNGRDYGVLCIDTMMSGELRYGVRYDELLAFIVAVI